MQAGSNPEIVARWQGRKAARTAPPSAATSGVVGALAAAESGAGTAATAIAVGVAATLVVMEAGPDTASVSVAVAIGGVHASVEAGSDSAAISGAHEALIQAALAAQRRAPTVPPSPYRAMSRVA